MTYFTAVKHTHTARVNSVRKFTNCQNVTTTRSYPASDSEDVSFQPDQSDASTLHRAAAATWSAPDGASSRPTAFDCHVNNNNNPLNGPFIHDNAG